MLLITAKLNNNNTEFVWWWWWVGYNTHNVVKPTSTWLWLSWVLTIYYTVQVVYHRDRSPELDDVFVLVACVWLKQGIKKADGSLLQ